MKYLYVIIVSLGFMLTSCSSNKVKIGLMLPVENERWIKDRDIILAKAKLLDVEVIVTNANLSASLEIEQTQQLIDQGVDVLLVIAVNKNTGAAIVRIAHENNVKVIAYDRFIQNCDLDYFVSFDNVKVGTLMAQYATKYVPEGKYYLLGGDKSDQNAVWMKQGWAGIIDPYIKSGKIKVVYDTYIEDWARDNAYHAIDQYLELSSNDVPDVILSAYDGLSYGAIDALNANNALKYPLITGQDAELKACQNIVNGTQAMTIYKPLKILADRAVELAIQCAKNQDIKLTDNTLYNGQKDVPSFLIDPISLDKTNMKSTVVADGFLKEEDIYNSK